MTIEQANSYFEALPDGFASTDQLRAALPASAQKVQFVGVAGTAGKTTVAALLAATLRAAGIHAGLYHAGCEPLSVRVRVNLHYSPCHPRYRCSENSTERLL